MRAFLERYAKAHADRAVHDAEAEKLEVESLYDQYGKTGWADDIIPIHTEVREYVQKKRQQNP